MGEIFSTTPESTALPPEDLSVMRSPTTKGRVMN